MVHLTGLRGTFLGVIPDRVNGEGRCGLNVKIWTELRVRRTELATP